MLYNFYQVNFEDGEDKMTVLVAGKSKGHAVAVATIELVSKYGFEQAVRYEYVGLVAGI